MEEYQPTTNEEVHNALKDIFGSILEAMLQGELDGHLGYSSNNYGAKTTENRRNGYIDKTVKSSYGKLSISVPRDRDGSFEPIAVPKRSKDITGMETC